ncbi:MarR family winged helix-turn-helix transcriptional regulator [Cucumibacter marinus]|uniref:MarR family winged helix-turn-helix transcriptional regulator n=1 Tax=Cucumibacter marinus TaxID=1121252 RepID=UPI00048EDD9C|nr:MarR family transcriptional regulator [Cucumibacter marinus]
MSESRTSFPRAGDLVAPHVNTLSKYLTRAAVQDARSRFGLGRVEWQIITLLGVFQPISVRELTFHALLDPAQISRAIRGLSERDIVAKRQSDRDRREVEVTLTAKGLSLHADLTIAAINRNKVLTEGFSLEEIRSLNSTLDLLVERAKTLVDSD